VVPVIPRHEGWILVGCGTPRPRSHRGPRAGSTTTMGSWASAAVRPRPDRAGAHCTARGGLKSSVLGAQNCKRTLDSHVGVARFPPRSSEGDTHRYSNANQAKPALRIGTVKAEVRREAHSQRMLRSKNQGDPMQSTQRLLSYQVVAG
jgi:hypothetical protein